MIKLTNVLYVYSPYCKIRFSFLYFFFKAAAPEIPEPGELTKAHPQN